MVDMIEKAPRWVEAPDLAACLELKARFGANALPVAGGTDASLRLRSGQWRPAVLFSLRASCLHHLKRTDDELTIGACVTMATLAADDAVRTTWSALAVAAGGLGSPLIRNLATLGGNLGNASPCADTAPPLLVYEAQIVVRSTRGLRSLPVERFFTGPGGTAMKEDELIIEVRVPRPPEGTVATFRKFGPRRANVIAASSLATALTFQDGVVARARLAAGSVAPTPLRLLRVEGFLLGRAATDLADPRIREEAAELLLEEVVPIDDVRGSAWYKGRVAANALIRELAAAAEKEAPR
ncbi:MAG: FAD binding domain-containing protein [Pseudomonadota bacterium]